MSLLSCKYLQKCMGACLLMGGSPAVLRGTHQRTGLHMLPRYLCPQNILWPASSAHTTAVI